MCENMNYIYVPYSKSVVLLFSEDEIVNVFYIKWSE